MKKSIYFLIVPFILGYSFIKPNNEKEHFSRIYETAVGGRNKDGLGSSGAGSTLEVCSEYISFIQNFLKEKTIQSVVDAGCGDWEFSQFIDWGDIDYSGFDVVTSVIERNIKTFTQENIHFFEANIVDTNLPSADLLISKDVLQHLDANRIRQFSSQFSKYKYCLITDGPTINIVALLHHLNPRIVLTFNGGETKKVVLFEFN